MLPSLLKSSQLKNLLSCLPLRDPWLTTPNFHQDIESEAKQEGRAACRGSSVDGKTTLQKKVLVTLLHLTVCSPMDCNPPGSSVHRILQARILEWVAISFSRVSSQPRDRTPGGLLHYRQRLYHLSHQISLGHIKKVVKWTSCGPVVKNLSASTGDTGSSPGLGGSHMPKGN